MKKILMVSLLSATALAGAANAEGENYYAKLNAGVSHGLKAGGNFSGSKLGNVGVYGFAAGYKLNENFRIDLGFDYRGSYKNKVTSNGVTASNKVKSYAAMVNVYYDIGEFNKFTPYVGAGLGVAYNKTGATSITLGNQTASVSKGKKTNFAWKLIAGASYAVDPNVDISLQYQYANLGKFSTGTKETANGKSASVKAGTGNVKAHEVLLGVTYKF